MMQKLIPTYYTNRQILNKTFFFLKILPPFRERGKEREREGNINVWLPLTLPPPGTRPTTQACALTGN